MAKTQYVRPFTPNQFVATQFDSAEEKAKRANDLAVFVQKGMPEQAWNKQIYHTLCQHMFGHIAHYDAGGFFATWFADAKKRLQWLSYAMQTSGPIFGDPKYTWSDVERAFRGWLNSSQCEALVEKLAQEAVSEQRALFEEMAQMAEDYLSRNPDEQVSAQIQALRDRQAKLQ